MLAFLYHFGLEAVGLGIVAQGLEVHVEPIECFATNLLVLHAEVYLAIVVACQIHEKTTVFVFEQVTQIT